MATPKSIVTRHFSIDAEMSFDPADIEDVRQLRALLEREGPGSLDEILVIAARRTDRIATIAAHLSQREISPEGRILITVEWLQHLLRGAYAQGAMDAHKR